MNRLLYSIIVSVLFFRCTDKPQQTNSNTPAPSIESVTTGSTASAAIKKDDPKNLYTDSGESSFKILSSDTANGYSFQAVEVNYKVAYAALKNYKEINHYIAKYTSTTKSCTGCELAQKSIKVELNAFDDPKKTALTIQQECDELTLDAHTYETIKYGCCGAEDQVAIYDYNNKLIIEGDSKILLGEIPNSQLAIFVAYKQEQKDSTTIGTLYYCYDSSDRYALKIKGGPLPEDCDPNVPDLEILSSNKRDEFDKGSNSYTFWSLDKLDNKNLIKNFTLKITFECDSRSKANSLTIPILNGKPFGKDEHTQQLMYGKK